MWVLFSVSREIIGHGLAGYRYFKAVRKKPVVAIDWFKITGILHALWLANKVDKRMFYFNVKHQFPESDSTKESA